MSVEVRTVRDPELRVQVVDQRTAFDSDPDGFSGAVEGNQDALQQRVVEAQQRLNQVTIDEDLRLRISAVCGELDVDGLRGTLSPTVRPVLSLPLKDALKSQKRMLLALRPAVCATACARTPRTGRLRRPCGESVLQSV